VRTSTLLPPSRRGEALERQKLPLETRATFSATVASGRGRPQEAPAGSTGSRRHRAALLCGKAADRTGSSPAPAGKKGCRGVSGRGGRAQCTWGPGALECKGVCLFDCVCVHKALVSVCVCLPVCASVCACARVCVQLPQCRQALPLDLAVRSLLATRSGRPLAEGRVAVSGPHVLQWQARSGAHCQVPTCVHVSREHVYVLHLARESYCCLKAAVRYTAGTARNTGVWKHCRNALCHWHSRKH